MSSYRLSKRAAADLDEIVAFTVERWGAAQADEYLDELKALFHSLSARPMIGRSAAHVLPNLRRMEHISHLVFYTTLPRGIRIEGILHKNRALRRKDFT